MYALIASLGFATLYGEAAFASDSPAATIVALVSFALTFAALTLPSRLVSYRARDVAPVVLAQLVRRAALGSALMVMNAALAWLLVGHYGDPTLIGELYVFALLAVSIYQGLGEAIAHHVVYLQETRQYNSNQLAAVILMLTLVLFVLILYFLAFDLARPPELHAYLRDMIAISVALVGFGRAVYLMGHH